jgi:hypothetical protein
MKKELDSTLLTTLEQLKDKMLLRKDSSHLLRITGFTVVKSEESRIFSKKMVTKSYLTDVRIESFHPDGRFLGILTDDSAHKYVEYYNLYALRQNWVDFLQQLEAFGLEVVKKDDVKSTT